MSATGAEPSQFSNWEQDVLFALQFGLNLYRKKGGKDLLPELPKDRLPSPES